MKKYCIIEKKRKKELKAAELKLFHIKHEVHQASSVWAERYRGLKDRTKDLTHRLSKLIEKDKWKDLDKAVKECIGEGDAMYMVPVDVQSYLGKNDPCTNVIEELIGTSTCK